MKDREIDNSKHRRACGYVDESRKRLKNNILETHPSAGKLLIRPRSFWGCLWLAKSMKILTPESQHVGGKVAGKISTRKILRKLRVFPQARSLKLKRSIVRCSQNVRFCPVGDGWRASLIVSDERCWRVGGTSFEVNDELYEGPFGARHLASLRDRREALLLGGSAVAGW